MMKKLTFIVFILLFPALGLATTYYYSTSGSDASGDATNYTTPYKTLAKLETTLANGTYKHLLLCGDTWDTADERGAGGTISITETGTDTDNRLVIGAYKADGSQVTSSNLCPGNLPQISRGSDAWPDTDGPADDDNTSVIELLGADYTTIEYIWFDDIYSWGIQSPWNGGNTTIDTIIQHCKFTDIWQQAFSGNRVATVTFSNNIIQGALLVWATDADCRYDSGPGAAIDCNWGCTNFTVSDNWIDESFGEGIGFYNTNQNSPYIGAPNNSAIIQDNFVGATRSSAIHATGWQSLMVQRNLLIMHNSGGNYTYFRGQPGSGALTSAGVCDVDKVKASNGIDLLTGNLGSGYSETYGPLTVMNNFVSGRGAQNATYSTSYPSDPPSPGIQVYSDVNQLGSQTMLNTKIYNNTVVDAGACFRLHDEDELGSGNQFRNNICYLTGDCTECVDYYQTYKDIDTWTRSNNFWSTNPVASEYDGTDDVYQDVVGAPGLETTTGFYFPATNSTLDATDFKLTVGSVCIDSGTDLGTYPTDAWARDYWLTNKDTYTPWDIGGHEYEGMPTAINPFAGMSCEGCKLN